MKTTLACEHFAVFDDVLPTGQLDELWKHFQTIPLRPINPGVPASPWQPTDGHPLTGTTIAAVASPDIALPASVPRQLIYPTATPVDHLIGHLLAQAPRLEPWVGRAAEQWVLFSTAAWIYPAESALSWHTDGNQYSGAFTFYVHPDWDMHWGGEFVIAHPSVRHTEGWRHIAPSDNPASGTVPRFERHKLHALLAEPGLGQFVAPTPNRLVVLAGGFPHRIARVDKAAGNHVRASLSGFFLGPRGLADLHQQHGSGTAQS